VLTTNPQSTRFGDFSKLATGTNRRPQYSDIAHF